MRSSSWSVVVSCGLVVGCGAAGPAHSPAAVPGAVEGLPAETCGQFEVVADKGKASAHAVTDLRARCNNSYTCSPRVASNKVELQTLAPGKTTLHLEYTDPATGNAYSDDVPVTVIAGQSHVKVRYGTMGCSYIPVKSRP